MRRIPSLRPLDLSRLVCEASAAGLRCLRRRALSVLNSRRFDHQQRLQPSARVLPFCWPPFCTTVETPAKRRGGCSGMTVVADG